MRISTDRGDITICQLSQLLVNYWQQGTAGVSGDVMSTDGTTASFHNFLRPRNPDVSANATIDISGVTTLTIANNSNATVKGSGLVIVREANQGDMAAYFIAPAGVVRNVALGFGNWVNSTTTPAAGQLSVAWDGVSAFKVYNAQGASETVYYFLIGK